MFSRRVFKVSTVCGFLLALLSFCDQSQGQYRGGIYRGGANPYNTKPTVSPYLNLLQQGNDFNNLPQYQTLVRPFLEQQSINEFNQRENQMMRQQINTIQGGASRGGAGAGANSMRSTGHPTRYMNYLHYYNMK